MNNQLTNAINLLHDSKLSSNLSNEQIKAITILEGAYLDLDKEYTDKIARRNMQIKDLKTKLLNTNNLTEKEKDTLWDCLVEGKNEWQKTLNLVSCHTKGYNKMDAIEQLENIKSIALKLFNAGLSYINR
jgi:hypothetical protein